MLSVILLALGVRRLAGDRAGLIAGGAARDQLRLRDVQPRRDHGGADGRLHRRVVVLLDARGRTGRGGARSRESWPSLAFFTKAAAAFYVGALGLAAVLGLCVERAPRGASDRDRVARASGRVLDARGARGVARSSCGARSSCRTGRDYQFYNWQMSVTRKPSYDLASAAAARVVVSDPARHVLAACGSCSCSESSARGASCRAGVGRRSPSVCCSCGSRSASSNCCVHDVGNERRLRVPDSGARRAGQPGARTPRKPAAGRGRAVSAARVLLMCPRSILYSAYIVTADRSARLPFLYEVRPQRARGPAALGGLVAWPRGHRVAGRASRRS